jgi:hypothetical protein
MRAEKTPAEAIDKQLNHRVTVEFHVGTVEEAVHTGFNAREARVMTLLPKDGLTGGGKLQVTLADKAVTQFHNLGLEPAAHFRGKVARVTGTIEATEEPVKKGTDYRLVAFDLQGVVIVKQ